MKRQSVLAAILVYVIAAAAVSAAAEVKFPEPTGFGKANFGMGVAEVRKLYPKLHPTKGTEQAVQQGEQAVLIYEMEDQSVGPLKACDAQMRFFNNEFYEVQFRCPDRAKVGDYLQKTYGEATKVSEKAVFWMGQKSAVSLAPRTGAFGFSDLKRTAAMQSFLFAQLNKMGVGVPGPAAAPGTTPASSGAPAAAPGTTPAPAAPAGAPPPAAEAPAAAPHE